MTEATQPTGGRRKSRLTPLLIAGALAVSFGAGAVGATVAPEAAAAARHHAGGAAMHAMGGAHLDKLLNEAGASAEQKARIKQITSRAFGSMKPLHGRMHDTHKAAHDILTAPQVDRAALERLRAERMADFDQTSKVMVAALADSAEVLTPAQRAKLAAAMAAKHREH